MKRIKSFIVLLLFSLVLTLTACKGKPLPDGMDAEQLFHAGKDVMLLMVEGNYDAIHALLREDQREQITVEQIRETVTAQLNGAGEYKQIDDHMTTGQTIDGVRYGIAVLYCDFSEEDVLVRISFDADMQLVGFSLKQD